MKNFFQKFFTLFIVFNFFILNFLAFAANEVDNDQAKEEVEDNSAEIGEQDSEEPNYLQPFIASPESIEVQKSTIFDASQSFIPEISTSNSQPDVVYFWDFGDGNNNEGVEVLHVYQDPGEYEVTLTISQAGRTSQISKTVFVYEKLIILITDNESVFSRVENQISFAKDEDIFLKVIDSFGSSTEFISEEILTKKLRENEADIQKAKEIIVWTKENSGLNAISRYLNRPGEIGDINENLFFQKVILNVTSGSNVNSNIGRIQNQFEAIRPKSIIVAQESAVNALISSRSEEEFLQIMNERGNVYTIVNSESGKINPWRFMSHFVNVMIDTGIPDNTIALLLLLPVIVTVVAFMRQVVGITTFGVYTPSIITLSFLVIGVYPGFLTLVFAILVGSLMRPLLKKVRMLFIPRMAIVITLVAFVLLLSLFFGINIGLFDAQFLSIAIFPMLILSTLVEKFVSAKTDKSLFSAAFLMGETLLVALVAYFIAGGPFDFGIVEFRFNFIKNLMLNAPEWIFGLLIVNIFLGKWTGLRILEKIRFREILRHIEEE